jgi:hypothetical protein
MEYKFKVIYRSTVYDEYEATVTAESEEEARDLIYDEDWDDREYIGPVTEQWAYDDELHIQPITKL